MGSARAPDPCLALMAPSSAPHYELLPIRQELYAISVWLHAAFSQRATWPPSAAVRQRSIALITFNWSRLAWPRLASRQTEPCSRRMSASSRAGRATADGYCAAVSPAPRLGGFRRGGLRRASGLTTRPVQTIIIFGTNWAATIDVGDWLRSLGLGQYDALFRENEIAEATAEPAPGPRLLTSLSVNFVPWRAQSATRSPSLRASSLVGAEALLGRREEDILKHSMSSEGGMAMTHQERLPTATVGPRSV